MGVRETELIGSVEVVRLDENKFEYERARGVFVGEVGAPEEGVPGTKRRREENGTTANAAGEGSARSVTEGKGKGAGAGSAGTSKAKASQGDSGEAETFIPVSAVEPQDAGGDGAAKSESEEDYRDEMPASSFSLPWEASCRAIHSPLLRLHQEIAAFSDFLEPSEEEAQMRRDAIDRVTAVIHGIWPHAEVKVFGSVGTGLYLPTSDVDMVVLNAGCADIPSGLRRVASQISRKNMGRNLLVLSKARIPIVKFQDIVSSLNFDISFDIYGGPQAANFINRMIRNLPQMRPLVMILKIFLQQRELNEVYSGGVGSYALIIMVNVMLMTHASRLERGGRAEACLGTLLIDFFELYGHTLDTFEVGISCRQGGFFYNKRDFGFWSVDRPWLLSIEDPLDNDSDIGKNSFNIQKVKQAFQFAHTLLTAPETEFGELFLMRIIRMDSLLVQRLATKKSKIAAALPPPPPSAHAHARARPMVPAGGKQEPAPAAPGGPAAPGRPQAASERTKTMTPAAKMDIMGVTEVHSVSSEEEEGQITGEQSKGVADDETESKWRKKRRKV